MQQYITISFIASIIINERSFLFSDVELFLVLCCSRGILTHSNSQISDMGQSVSGIRFTNTRLLMSRSSYYEFTIAENSVVSKKDDLVT
jgi:hypothetical protein